MKQLVLLLLFFLSACGTTNTVVRDEYKAVKNLKEANTYCGSIPRVYSGAAYDICMLNAEPVRVHNDGLSEITDITSLPFAFIDLLISFALDTLALPYTTYRQHKDGNIEIE